MLERLPMSQLSREEQSKAPESQPYAIGAIINNNMRHMQIERIENKNILKKPWEKNIVTLAIEPCTTKNNMGLEESMKEPNNVLILKSKDSKSATIYLEVLNLPPFLEDFGFSKLVGVDSL